MLFQLIDFIKQFGISKLNKIAKAHTFSMPILRGFFLTHALFALWDTGLWNSLKQGCSIQEASDSNKLEKRSVAILFDYLYSIDFLAKKDERYYLNRGVDKNIDLSAGAFLFTQAYSPYLADLTNILKKTSTARRNDKKMVQASAETEKWVPYPLVVKMIQKYHFTRVLDVGCGSCQFLIDLCEHNPNIQCRGIDLSSSVIEVAKANIDIHSLGKRISVVQGDFLRSEAIDLGGWQPHVITFMYVLHELLARKSQKEIVDALLCLARRLQNAKLFICELSPKSPEVLHGKTSLLAEHFFYHALSGQKVIPGCEWRKAFRDAGFVSHEEFNFEFLGQSFFLLGANG